MGPGDTWSLVPGGREIPPNGAAAPPLPVEYVVESMLARDRVHEAVGDIGDMAIREGETIEDYKRRAVAQLESMWSGKAYSDLTVCERGVADGTSFGLILARMSESGAKWETVVSLFQAVPDAVKTFGAMLLSRSSDGLILRGGSMFGDTPVIVQYQTSTCKVMLTIGQLCAEIPTAYVYGGHGLAAQTRAPVVWGDTESYVQGDGGQQGRPVMPVSSLTGSANALAVPINHPLVALLTGWSESQVNTRIDAWYDNSGPAEHVIAIIMVRSDSDFDGRSYEVPVLQLEQSEQSKVKVGPFTAINETKILWTLRRGYDRSLLEAYTGVAQTLDLTDAAKFHPQCRVLMAFVPVKMPTIEITPTPSHDSMVVAGRSLVNGWLMLPTLERSLATSRLRLKAFVVPVSVKQYPARGTVSPSAASILRQLPAAFGYAGGLIWAKFTEAETSEGRDPVTRMMGYPVESLNSQAVPIRLITTINVSYAVPSPEVGPVTTHEIVPVSAVP